MNRAAVDVLCALLFFPKSNSRPSGAGGCVESACLAGGQPAILVTFTLMKGWR